MIANSTNINQSPRVIKNLNNADFVFLLPYKKAEVPARNTNTGAQK
jgi:hypothetical protein